jgi:hypothetical protein
MEQVSITLQIIFITITLSTVAQFYRATKQSKTFLVIIFIWGLQIFIPMDLQCRQGLHYWLYHL